MSRYNTLEPLLQEIVRMINPMGGDMQDRWQIILDLRQIVGSIRSLRGVTVEPYGSYVSEHFSRWGNLDISIEISNGSWILFAGRKYKLDLLDDLFKVLKQIDGWSKLKLVENSRSPIILCKNTNANISCKISINNLSGLMKSKILLWLSEIDDRFRPMILLVKEWAKAHEVNDPKTKTFGSYCLTMLVIFHLQTCMPAILPPLQQIYPGNMVDDLHGIRSDVERHIEETCRGNIIRFNRFKQRNPISLGQLFVSFIAKFSDINSWAATHGVCSYTGKWEAIDSNTTWLPRTYCLHVEDPFEQPSNTARTVKEEGLVRIAEAFQNTLQKLNSRDHGPAYILPFLVPYETSQLLPGTVFNGPQMGYNNRAQPQINRQNRPWQVHPQERPQNRIEKKADKKGSTSQDRVTERLVWRSRAENEEKVEVEKQEPYETSSHIPTRASKNQEKQIWRKRSDGEKAEDDKQATGEASVLMPIQVYESNKGKQIWRSRSDKQAIGEGSARLSNKQVWKRFIEPHLPK